MVHLTLAGLSEDGKRLLLVDDQGAEFTLDADAALRRALRGEHARLGQLEIHMDSALRPRDIQARIRSGQTPEAVAQTAQTTVDRIMPFAAPVLAERAHVADRAQRASVRRPAGEAGARTLGDAVRVHLQAVNVPEESVEWDAWRREDGRWTLTGEFATPKRKGTATFVFDAPGNFVVADDDDAKWLVGEPVDRPAAQRQPRQRRLSAVPADELPLGEDALELVADEPGGPTDTPDATDPSGTDAADGGDTSDTADASGEERSGEGGSSFLASAFERQNAEADETAGEQAPDTGGAAGSGPSEEADDQVVDGASPVDAEEVHHATPAEEEPAAPRRSVSKKRGRASVPSWDEIMFGGGKGD